MTALKFHRSLGNAGLPARGKYLPELPDDLQAAADALIGLAPEAGVSALVAASVDHALPTVPGYHRLEVLAVRPGRYSETDFSVDLGYIYPLNLAGEYTDAVEAAADALGGWSVTVGTVTICYGGRGLHFAGNPRVAVSPAGARYLDAVEASDKAS